MIKKLTTILFLTSVFVSAQEIHFAVSHDKQGAPIVEQKVWEMKPWGVTIDIIYNNGENKITENNLYMYVDKFEDGKFQPYDSKALPVNKRKNFVSYKYDFTEVGKYQVYFSSSASNILAKKGITVKLAARFSPERLASLRPYYSRARLYFCDWVIDEKPVNVKHTINLRENKSFIVVYLKMDKPINTDTLVVDLWEENPVTGEFDRFIRTKKYRTKSDWHDTFFKYRFRKPGMYKIALFNTRSELIKERIIEVTR